MTAPKETWTAARCAHEWGVTESTWRSYVSTHRAPQPLPGYDDDRRRRWDPTPVTTWPRPGQGHRSDLTADRIGHLVATARIIAEARNYDEYSKIYARILDGNPAAVRALVTACQRWAKHHPAPADVVTACQRVEQLAGQIGDLGAKLLPLVMRERVIRAVARQAPIAAHNENPNKAFDAGVNDAGSVA